MNQIPNIEEEWVEAPEAVRSKCRAICGENDIDTENEDVFIYRRIEIDTATDIAYQAGLSTHHHQLQKARKGNANELYGEGHYNGVMYERERIEAIFKEHVPQHAMDLEDSVWLKRLLNKAFNHDKNV